MRTRTRVLTGVLAALALAGGAAGAAAAPANTHTRGPLTFDLHLTALRVLSHTRTDAGVPTKPLVPGDRVIGQDRLLQSGVPAGHDNEVSTVAFARNVLCQDIIIFAGRGGVQASWGFRWPATGPGPASFDGIIDGGTAAFRDAHGTFHAYRLPNGDLRITADVGSAW